MIEELEKFLKSQAKKITDYLFESVEKIVERKSNLDVYEVIGLIPENKVESALGIKRGTLKKWRDCGLNRYKAPYDEASKYYYKPEEIKNFMIEDMED